MNARLACVRCSHRPASPGGNRRVRGRCPTVYLDGASAEGTRGFCPCRGEVQGGPVDQPCLSRAHGRPRRVVLPDGGVRRGVHAGSRWRGPTTATIPTSWCCRAGSASARATCRGPVRSSRLCCSRSRTTSRPAWESRRRTSPRAVRRRRSVQYAQTLKLAPESTRAILSLAMLYDESGRCGEGGKLLRARGEEPLLGSPGAARGGGLVARAAATIRPRRSTGPDRVCR